MDLTLLSLSIKVFAFEFSAESAVAVKTHKAPQKQPGLLYLTRLSCVACFSCDSYTDSTSFFSSFLFA